MTDIKLIATDIDGTLFDSNKHYNINRFNDYLEKLHQQGVGFAVASGNNLDHLQRIFTESPNIDIFIAENGAQVINKQEILFEQFMPKDLVVKMINVLRENLQIDSMSLSGKNASYSESLENLPLYHMGNLVEVDNLADVSDNIFKFNIQLPADNLPTAEQFINDTYGTWVNAAASGFGSIDIMSAGVNKSVGLHHLTKKLPFDLSNVMTFGDNTNDLEMIQDSGLGVAMINGKQQVKDAANLITKTDNNHDGVLNTIQEFFDF